MTITPFHFTTDKFFANHNPLSKKFFEKRYGAASEGLYTPLKHLSGMEQYKGHNSLSLYNGQKKRQS